MSFERFAFVWFFSKPESNENEKEEEEKQNLSSWQSRPHPRIKI